MTNDNDNGSVQVFKFSRGSKWTVLAAISTVTLLPAFMAVLIFRAHAGVAGAAWVAFLLAVSVAGAAALCWFPKYARTAFLEIGPDHVRTVNLFKTTSMRFDEAAEMEVVWKTVANNRRKYYIRITPKDAARKPMKISYAYEYMGDAERLLYVAIPSEAATLARESRAVVYSGLAGTDEQKAAALAGITTQCERLLAAALAATFYGLFHPRPYLLVMAILMLLPVAAVFYTRKFGNAVTLEIDRTGSVRPSVFVAFLFPACALAYLALVIGPYFSMARAVWPCLAAGGAMFFYSFKPRAVNIRSEYPTSFFLSLLYGVGAGIFLGRITGFLPSA